MQIIIKDRESVERGLVIRAGAYALISVRDPDKRKVKYGQPPSRTAVLELAFHDAEPARGFQLPPHIRLITEDDAQQIARFVRLYQDQVKAFVVHCEQGMSRSPAIGAAIAQALGLDTTRYRRDYQPNQYVRELVLEAFESSGDHKRVEQSHTCVAHKPGYGT